MIERLVSKEDIAEDRKMQVKEKVIRLLGEYCSRQYRIGTTDILLSALLSPELFSRIACRIDALDDFNEICFISTYGLRSFFVYNDLREISYGAFDIQSMFSLLKVIQKPGSSNRIGMYYDGGDDFILEKYGDHWYYLTPRVLEGGLCMSIFTEALSIGLTYDDVISFLPNMPKGGKH